MNERMASVLLMLEGSPRGGVQLSGGIVGERLGLTQVQGQWLLKRMRERGLVKARPRFLASGAQVESAYVITPAGRAFLAERWG